MNLTWCNLNRVVGSNYRVIRPFDPWSSPLCTCPPKYSFSPYTGCAHGCLYCYVDYINQFEKPRPKKELLKWVEHDLGLIKKGSIISISNSSDPYQPQELLEKNFRRALEIISQYPLKILIVTKSDMVLRDLDILKKVRCAVTVTITTLKEDLARKLEPFAPSPNSRLMAIKELTKNGIRCGVRIDPIIPYLNEGEVEEIVKEVKRMGALHVVSSTYKAKKKNLLRMREAFPEISRKLEDLYLLHGKKIGNSFFMEENRRRELMETIRIVCKSEGITFSTCREGFPELRDSQSCDGSHLVP